MKPVVFNLSCVIALTILFLVLIGMVTITTIKFKSLLGTTQAEMINEGSHSTVISKTLSPILPISNTELENSKPIFLEHCTSCHSIQIQNERGERIKEK